MISKILKKIKEHFEFVRSGYILKTEYEDGTAPTYRTLSGRIFKKPKEIVASKKFKEIQKLSKQLKDKKDQL